MGTSPPLNSIVNTTKNVRTPRPGRFFLESGYARATVKITDSAVPRAVTMKESIYARRTVPLDEKI